MKKKWVYIFIFTVVIVNIILVPSINLDLNHDGSINIQDLQLLVSHYEGKVAYNSSFDLNNDSKIDLFDLVKVAKQINNTVSVMPSPPTVTLNASPTSITSGQSSTLSWSSTNAISCTASNGWSGTKSTSGTQSIMPSSTTTYTLMCTGSGGSASSNAQVTVTSGGSNGSVGGLHANEPAGFTQITERGFDALDEDGWTHQNISGSYNILPAAGGPQGGSAGMITYPAGFRGGKTPASVARSIPKSRSIYIAFWLKLSSNWEPNPDDVNKVLYMTDNSYGGGGDPAYLDLVGGNPAKLSFQICEQGPAGSPNWTPNIATVYAPVGEWHFVEIVLVMNSAPNASDGQAYMWVDGNETTNYTNIQWEDSSGNRYWDSVRWEPIWGGADGTTSQTMYQYMDYIYISGK